MSKYLDKGVFVLAFVILPFVGGMLSTFGIIRLIRGFQ